MTVNLVDGTYRNFGGSFEAQKDGTLVIYKNNSIAAVFAAGMWVSVEY